MCSSDLAQSGNGAFRAFCGEVEIKQSTVGTVCSFILNCIRSTHESNVSGGKLYRQAGESA